MSVTCGFFNSKVDENNKSDRLYTAEQMSAIFDGIINDGVFAGIGDKLLVSATDTPSNTVNVAEGKCWFNHTWTLNDAILPIDCGSPHSTMTRIDAIVVDVDSSTSVRNNSIKVIQGTASSYNPAKPTLYKSTLHNQYALCYITRKPNATAITNADIENAVGTSETPFVTGIIEVTDLDKLAAQWKQVLDDSVAENTEKMTNFITTETTKFNTWDETMKLAMETIKNELLAWSVGEKTMIMNWFDTVKGQLSEDPALNLQIQIDADEVERYLIEGLPDGTKTISDDGTVIRTVDSQGRVLTKTFTNNFSTITSVLKNREDKSYLPYPYLAFNGAKTVTRYGVTFTDNGDGTVTANGTATAIIWFILPGNDFTLPKDTYSLSGCPVGGSEETYYFGASLYNDSTIVTNSTVNDIGSGATLDTTDKTYTSARIFICIKSGTTVNNVIFNPKVITTGVELGRLVKKISADGKTITSTLTNYSDTIPNLVEIERGIDTIIATENSYIGGVEPTDPTD